MTRHFSLCLGCFAVLFLAGCGSKTSPVSGTVNLDGQAVAGATVIFTSDSGSVVASGLTDEQGRYSLAYQNAPKIPAGSYKVSVMKTKVVEGQAPGNPDDKAANKAYLEEMKKFAPKTTGPGMMTPGPGGAGKGPPTKTGGGKSPDILPAVYASAATTTITAQVPAPQDTVNIELKSK